MALVDGRIFYIDPPITMAMYFFSHRIAGLFSYLETLLKSRKEKQTN